MSPNKKILVLALPMILSNISNPLLGMVDTAIIGHFDGSHFLAGTAVASMLLSQLYWLCGFFRMSATGLSAQAKGAGSQQQAGKVFYQLLFPALILGGLMILAQPLLIYLANQFGNANEQVALVIQQYLAIRIWGAPAALANLLIMGWLIGQQATRTVMWIQIFVNLLNAVLSLYFAVYLEWQVAGVALATLIAEYTMLFLGALAVLSRIEWLRPRACWFSWANTKGVLSLNLDIFFRSLFLQLTLAFMTFQGAQLGQDFVAVNALLMQFFVITALGLDGIAFAVEALVGESKGKRQPRHLHQWVVRGVFWSTALACMYSAVFVLFDQFILGLLTDIENLRATAREYLVYVWLLPLVSHWCFLLDGVFIGLTQAKAMRNNMFISSLFVFMPVWFVFQAEGNHGLWVAFLCFFAARGAGLGWEYYLLWKNSKLCESDEKTGMA